MSVAAVAALAPYIIEALGLATTAVQTLSSGDEVDLETLKARFEASRARRDQAISDLDAAIAAARDNQPASE